MGLELGTSCSGANGPQLFVHMCVFVRSRERERERKRGLAWLLWRMFAVVTARGSKHVYELPFCAELITLDQGIRIRMVAQTHAL